MKVKFVYTPEWDEVTAVFVDSMPSPRGFIDAYSHVGQHGACSEEWVNEQQPATFEQYAPLLEELKSIGYNDIEIV